MKRVLRNLHLRGATGTIRTAVFQKKEHVVVPVVALVEGVIYPINAETPELVLAEEFHMAPQGWNGRPTFAGHPEDGGTQVSGNTPRTLEQHAFGLVFNAEAKDRKLEMEAWLDPDRAKEVGDDALRILERIKRGETIEVSVGCYVVAEEKAGTYNGKRYNAIWRSIVPDHLALLPEGDIGACSVAMGCGTPRNAMVHLVTAKGMSLITAGGPGSGPHPSGDTKAGHKDAARAHKDAAEAHEQASQDHANGSPNAAVSTKEANSVTQDAVKTSKGTGSLGGHDDNASAADHSKEAVKSSKEGSKTEAINHHEQAAKYHRRMMYHHEKQADKRSAQGASMADDKRKTFRERIKNLAAVLVGLQDSPEEAAAEEAAELIQYNTLSGLIDQVTTNAASAKKLIADLIADEQENPTETAAQEDAEEEVENARVRSLLSYCSQMMSAVYGIGDICSGMLLEDMLEEMNANGNEDPRYAKGARHSKKDQEAIQSMHDNSVKLGAECAAPRAAAEHGCGCGAAKGDSMTRAERIKALLAHPHNTVKEPKVLEAASDGLLETFEKQANDLKAAADKKAADEKAAADKAAADKAAADEAAKQPQTEEEWLKTAPASIRDMVSRQKTADQKKKDELVAGLKTAQSVYSEDKLKTMSIEELENLDKLVKSTAAPVDYSGRGAGVPRDAKQNTVPAPPSLEDAIRARDGLPAKSAGNGNQATK